MNDKYHIAQKLYFTPFNIKKSRLYRIKNSYNYRLFK